MTAGLDSAARVQGSLVCLPSSTSWHAGCSRCRRLPESPGRKEGSTVAAHVRQLPAQVLLEEH